MKVCFYTFGCKVNQFETEALRELFERDGWQCCDDAAAADACVVNSCTVTAAGDSKSLQRLRRVRRENPACVTVLCGCFPQAFSERAAQVEQADIVAGTRARSSLPALVRRFMAERERIVAVTPHEKGEAFENLVTADFGRHTRAFMKIEDGCERFCSYCIVPFSRGPVRSMPLAELAAQAQRYADAGYREIVLAGINLCCYGRELGLTLADAVNAAAAPTGIVRVRLSSVEPDLLDDELITRLAAEPKLCAHFHVSLQSGCARTLKSMGRLYTPKDFLLTTQKLRAAFGSVTLTTDVITGFPGESDEDFADSLRFVSEFGFLKCHVFPYSVRPGTRAAALPDQLSTRAKKERAEKMIAAAEPARRRVIASFAGRTVRAISEQPDADGNLGGYCDEYVPVLIRRAGVKRGDVVSGTASLAADGEHLVIE